MNSPSQGNLGQQPGSSVDRLSDHAQDAIRTTRRSAHDALDSLSSSVDELRQAMPASMQRMADSARQMGSNTVGYVRQEPLKSALLAVAVGALALGLVAMFSRSQR